MSDITAFEALVASDSEQKIAQQAAADKLAAAIYDVREQYGEHLFCAKSKDEFNDRVALCKDDMIRTVNAHLMPVTGVMRKVCKAMEREWKQKLAYDEDADFDALVADRGSAPAPDRSGPRPLHEIAKDIKLNWPKVNYAAQPYLDALHELESVDDMYYADPARHIVNYFLSNAGTWRGPEAKRIKDELKAMVRGASRHTADTTGPVQDLDQTFHPSDDNLIPEGDFHGYLDSVDQDAPSKVDRNFTPGGDSGKEARRRQANEMMGYPSTGGAPVAPDASGMVPTDPAQPPPPGTSGSGTPGAGSGAMVTASIIKRYAQWCVDNLARPSFTTMEYYAANRPDREYFILAAALQRHAEVPGAPAPQANGSMGPMLDQDGNQINALDPLTVGDHNQLDIISGGGGSLWAQGGEREGSRRIAEVPGATATAPASTGTGNEPPPLDPFGAESIAVGKMYQDFPMGENSSLMSEMNPAWKVGRTAGSKDYLQQADEAITNLLNEKAEEFQESIQPLQQALQTIQYAEQVQQAQNPMNVMPPAGTVNVLPQTQAPQGPAPQGVDPASGQIDPAVLQQLMGMGGIDPAAMQGGGEPTGVPPAAAQQGALPPEIAQQMQMQARRRQAALDPRDDEPGPTYRDHSISRHRGNGMYSVWLDGKGQHSADTLRGIKDTIDDHLDGGRRESRRRIAYSEDVELGRGQFQVYDAEGEAPSYCGACGCEHFGDCDDLDPWGMEGDDEEDEPKSKKKKESRRRTAGQVDLTEVRIHDNDHGASGSGLFTGKHPDGHTVVFQASPEDARALLDVMHGDLAQNFTGVSVDESDIVEHRKEGRRRTAMPMTEDGYVEGDGWIPGEDFDPHDPDEMEIMEHVFAQEKMDAMRRLQEENEMLRGLVNKESAVSELGYDWPPQDEDEYVRDPSTVAEWERGYSTPDAKKDKPKKAEAPQRGRTAKDSGCTCWEGYERVPNTEPCASGSCRKKKKSRRLWVAADGSKDLGNCQMVCGNPAEGTLDLRILGPTPFCRNCAERYLKVKQKSMGEGQSAGTFREAGIFDEWQRWIQERAQRGQLGVGGEKDIIDFAQEKGVGQRAVEQLKRYLFGSRKQAWMGWGPIEAARQHDAPGWEWDKRLSAYVATDVPDHFACKCGAKLSVPGYHNCKCGKIWNSYVIGTGGENRQAAVEKFLCREVPVRDNVIVAGKKTASCPARYVLLPHWDIPEAFRILRQHHNEMGTHTALQVTPELMDHARAGGFTLHDHVGDAPTDGYMVSLDKHSEEAIPIAELTPQMIEAFVTKHAENLGKKGNYLGGWLDNGRFYLDVSSHVPDLNRATGAAVRNKQLGIYDLGKGRTIDTEEAGYMTGHPGVVGRRNRGTAHSAQGRPATGRQRPAGGRRTTAAGKDNCPACGKGIRSYDLSGTKDHHGQAWCKGCLPDGIKKQMEKEGTWLDAVSTRSESDEGDTLATDEFPSDHHPDTGNKLKSTPDDWHRRDKNQRWTGKS